MNLLDKLIEIHEKVERTFEWRPKKYKTIVEKLDNAFFVDLPNGIERFAKEHPRTYGLIKAAVGAGVITGSVLAYPYIFNDEDLEKIEPGLFGGEQLLVGTSWITYLVGGFAMGVVPVMLGIKEMLTGMNDYNMYDC